jgi:hypothetical protein
MNAKCKACGGKCCKYIGMTDIPGGLHNLLAVRGAKFLGGVAFFPCQCPRLTEAGECSIYVDRPTLCRDAQVGGTMCKKITELFG